MASIAANFHELTSNWRGLVLDGCRPAGRPLFTHSLKLLKNVVEPRKGAQTKSDPTFVSHNLTFVGPHTILSSIEFNWNRFFLASNSCSKWVIVRVSATHGRNTARVLIQSAAHTALKFSFQFYFILLSMRAIWGTD